MASEMLNTYGTRHGPFKLKHTMIHSHIRPSTISSGTYHIGREESAPSWYDDTVLAAAAAELHNMLVIPRYQ